MRFVKPICWSLPLTLVGVLLANPAAADPFGIELLTSTHTVTLSWDTRVGTNGQITNTRTTTSVAPVSDAYFTAPFQPLLPEGTSAVAGLFDISSYSNEIGPSSSDIQEGAILEAWSYTTTELVFAPIASGTAQIGLTFFTDFLFSSALVSVVDLTTASELWSAGWRVKFGYLDAVALMDAPPTMATYLDASHVYQLTMLGHSDAKDDTTPMRASVSGLQVVPEPSTLSVAVVGLLTLLRRPRRKRR